MRRTSIPFVGLVLAVHLSLAPKGEASCINKPIVSQGSYTGCRVIKNGKSTIYPATVVEDAKKCEAFCLNASKTALNNPQERNNIVEKMNTVLKHANDRLTAAGGCLRNASQSNCHDNLKTKNSGETKSPEPLYDGFNDLLEEITKSSKDPCSYDIKKLRLRSLEVLNQAISHIFGETPLHYSSQASENDKEFKEILKKQWDIILSKLQIHSTEQAPVRYRDSLFYTPDHELKIAKEYVTAALDSGMIPIPTLSEQTKDGKSLFGYASLSQYFYAGIAPIQTGMIPDSDIAKRDEHPLNSIFFDGSLAVADHDIQHAELMGLNRRALGADIQANCSKVKACFESLADTQTPSMRKDLFYLLHEDSAILPLRRQASLPKEHHPHHRPFHSQKEKVGFQMTPLFEFSVESVLENKKSRFKLSNLLGTTRSEEEKICGELNTFYAFMSKNNRIVTEYKETQDQSALKDLNEQETLQFIAPYEAALNKLFPNSTYHAMRDDIHNNIIWEDDPQADQFRHLQHNFLLRLAQKCRTKGHKTASAGPPAHINKQFDEWKKKGFHETVEKEILSRITRVRKILAAMDKSEACKGIYY